MEKCMACEKNVLFSTTFGNVVLCKNCSSLVNVSTWNGRNFDSMDDLMKKKQEALQSAKANNMPQLIVDEIIRFFDEYINAGFISSINGKAGQILKLFPTHCIVVTKNESKKSELVSTLCNLDDSVSDDDSLISSIDKSNVVNGLLSGRLVQTGIGMVVSATMNKQEKNAEKRARERRNNSERLITVGERRIELSKIEQIEFFGSSNSNNGGLKFVPKGVSSYDIYNCEYFIFNNSIPFETKKIKQKLENAKKMLEERISVINQEVQQSMERIMHMQQTEQQVQSNSNDPFDEIRKFKQLLDEGIISEEDFNVKKKSLLGL